MQEKEQKSIKILLLISSLEPGTGASSLVWQILNYFKQNKLEANHIVAGGKILRALAQKYIELKKENENYSITDYLKKLEKLLKNDDLVDFLEEALKIELQSNEGAVSEEDFANYLEDIKLAKESGIETKLIDQIIDQFPLLNLIQQNKEKTKKEAKVGRSIDIIEAKLAVLLGTHLEKKLFKKVIKSYDVVIRVTLAAYEKITTLRVLIREINNDNLEYMGNPLDPETKGKVLKLLESLMDTYILPNLNDAHSKIDQIYNEFEKENPQLTDWIKTQSENIFEINNSRTEKDKTRWFLAYKIAIKNIIDEAHAIIDTTQRNQEEVGEEVLGVINQEIFNQTLNWFDSIMLKLQFKKLKKAFG